MMWVKSTMSQSLEITNGSITDSMLMECQKIKVSLITAWILLNHILTERVLLIVHRRESDYRSSSRRLGLDGNEFFSWNGHMWHTTPNNSIQKQHVEIIVEAHQQSSRGKTTCLNWTHRAYFNRLYLECQSRVEWYHPSWSYEMTIITRILPEGWKIESRITLHLWVHLQYWLQIIHDHILHAIFY